MFALLALICFVLALFHVALGTVDLVILGFVFISVHLLWEIPFPVGRARVRR